VSRRRRAVLLAGLAIVLAALAASDVAGRESALRRAIGEPVPVVVVRRDLRPGDRLDARTLAVRMVPSRFAPALRYASTAAVTGLKAATDIPAGADLQRPLVDGGAQGGGAPVNPGERIADVVAAGSPQLIVPGGHVDVLVTRERGEGEGSTRLALQDAEVLAVRPVDGKVDDTPGTPHVAVSLRVTAQQAMYLAAAQNFARELRLLPRAAGDRRRVRGATTVTANLR
jgi:pilus assembly protein CpaB